MMTHRGFATMVVSVAVCTCGCRSETQPGGASPGGGDRPAATEPRTNRRQQQHVAVAAREALFQRLQARLAEVLPEAGPVEAIEVCKSDAPRLAEQVGQEYGVVIGRTSHRLRNPDNAPRPWARSLVELRPEEPEFIGLSNDRLGALLPIRLNEACLLCHGPREQIPDDVQTALATHYPHDQATGFREGELRGWFWIEVPAHVRPPQRP
jgi:hypothetical protein